MMGLAAMLQDLECSPKGIVYAGAHHAEHLPEMLACGFERVLMVEPNPAARSVLGPLVSDRVRFVPAALDARGGRVTYFAAPGHFDILGSILEPGDTIAARTAFERCEVEAVTLDALLAEEKAPINVLYMNVQGAEQAALEGAGASLDRFDIVACEVDFSPRYRNGVVFTDLESYLAARGLLAVGLWRNDDPENDYGMACFARRRPSIDFGAFARPSRDTGMRRRLLGLARTRRAERVVAELLGRMRLDPNLLRAIELLPARAATAPEHVEPALVSLANVDLDHPKLFPAAIAHAAVVRAVVAAAGPVGFSAVLPAPMRLRWRGVLSPPAIHVAFDPAAPDALVVTLRSQKSLTLTPDHDRAVPLPSFRLGHTRATLLPGWARDACSSPWLDVGLDPSTLETPVQVREAEEASAWLGEVSPEHLAWISEVALDLSPVDGRDGRLRSATHPSSPGRIAATFHGVPGMLAELLVHESSHLFFHLANELDPLEDGSDDALYWSPAKKAPRPIGKILLAFHAWANITSLFEAAIAKGLDHDGHATRSLAVLREDMAAMAEPLRTSRALTEHGRALVAPFL